MTANELADELENTYPFVGVMEIAATMLRQQKAEIETLKELNTMLKDAIEKRIGMDAERYSAHPVKLTDEEIWDWFKENTALTKESALMIARAILRKAQEK